MFSDPSSPVDSSKCGMSQCTVFQSKFVEAINQCYQELDQKETSFEKVKIFVTNTFFPESIAKEGQRDDLFSTDEDIDDIFRTLSRHKLWDYQNYSLLQDLVLQFANKSPQLSGLMSRYAHDLSCYQRKTLIFDTHDSQDKNVSVNGLFQLLTVELSISAENLCLDYVADFSGSLVHQFSLVPATVLLKKVTKYPFKLMWLIPTVLCKKICEQISSNHKWLEERNVALMAFEDKVVYTKNRTKVSVTMMIVCCIII